ncbi:MAG: Flp family type IVb pilin [Gemmatimonas sp.]
MFTTLKSFIRDESGATMIEYGLIAALVSVVAIAALGAMGGNLRDMFTHVSDCLTQAQAGAAC